MSKPIKGPKKRIVISKDAASLYLDVNLEECASVLEWLICGEVRLWYIYFGGRVDMG